MNELICLDMLVDEEHTDQAEGLMALHVTFGWEEESLPTGETRYRVYCEDAVFVQALKKLMAEAVPDVCMEETVTAKQDWTEAWREFFTPVPCGRFLVLPPWLAAKTPSEGRVPIVIEPKCAFGTGHHNTTVLCLEAISQLLEQNAIAPGMEFFDVGTGTGILGIGCALCGLTGIGADIDPLSVSNATENAVINQVQERFSVTLGSAEQAKQAEQAGQAAQPAHKEQESQAGQARTFDLVLANILAGPLRELAPALLPLVKPGGALVLSGILDVQADAVEQAYGVLGPARRLTSGDWVALIWA